MIHIKAVSIDSQPKLPSFLLAALFAIIILSGCDYCKDADVSEPYEPYLSLFFFLADDDNAYENESLYARDTVYPGYDFDSLTFTPLNDAPINQLNMFVTENGSGLSFYFGEYGAEWKDQFIDSTASFRYEIRYNAADSDEIRIEFQLGKVFARCHGDLYHFEHLQLYYNDSLVVDYEYGDPPYGSYPDLYLPIYKSPG